MGAVLKGGTGNGEMRERNGKRKNGKRRNEEKSRDLPTDMPLPTVLPVSCLGSNSGECQQVESVLVVVEELLHHYEEDTLQSVLHMGKEERAS